jgi:hypothetical protein
MRQPHGDEGISPAGSITVGFCCLGAKVTVGRHALRQRALDRAMEGRIALTIRGLIGLL